LLIVYVVVFSMTANLIIYETKTITYDFQNIGKVLISLHLR
jgi:hypothetical protein